MFAVISCVLLSVQLCVASVGYLELMLAVRTPLTQEEFEASDKGQVAQLLKEGEECRREGRGGEECRGEGEGRGGEECRGEGEGRGGVQRGGEECRGAGRGGEGRSAEGRGGEGRARSVEGMG